MTQSEISGWWDSIEEEKYWIESTDRSDIGLNLLAPVSTNAYQKLVSSVKSGDIVLHYFQPSQSIVAFSTAVGESRHTKIRWPDRINSPEGPGHTIDLTGYTELESPIHLSEIRIFESEIRKIQSQLLEKYGKPIYFPYQIRTANPIRPSQGAYLSKFPSALLVLFPSLVQELESRIPNFEIPIEQTLKNPSFPVTPKKSTKSGGFGRIKDEVKKKTIETYAMKKAEKYLQELGYATEDVSAYRNIGYDIEAKKFEESIGVEVKGSSITDKFSIDLSKNEVDFAISAKHKSIDMRAVLLLVDGIELLQVDGDWKASGGTIRIFWDWYPLETSLIPTSYRYVLPSS